MTHSASGGRTYGLVFALILVTLILLNTGISRASSLIGLSVSEEGDTTRLSLMASGPVGFKEYLRPDPLAIVLDLQGVTVDRLNLPFSVDSDAVGVIEGSGNQLVIGLKKRMAYRAVAGSSGLTILLTRTDSGGAISKEVKPSGGPSAGIELPLVIYEASTAKGHERLSLDASDGTATLELTGPSGVSRYEVVRLSDPQRLIIDAWGVTLPSAEKSFSIEGRVLKSVGVSGYRDRLRILLTFASSPYGDSSEYPAYRVARSNSGLSIEIAEPSLARAPAVSVPAKQKEGIKVAQVPAPVVGPQGMVYTGRRVTLDFMEVDVRTVLRLLSDVSRLNIVSGPDVTGALTIRMVNTAWDQVLVTIMEAKGYETERFGNVIRVATAKTFKEEREARLKEVEAEEARRKLRERAERTAAVEARKTQLELEEMVVRSIPLSYASATEVAKQLDKFKSDRPTASVTPAVKTNTILIRDLEANTNRMIDLVKQLDVPTPQVQIEARIVEIRADFARDIGVQWGFHAGNRAGTFAFRGGEGLAVMPGDVREARAVQLPSLLPGAVATSGSHMVVNLPAPVGAGSGGAIGLTIGRITDTLQIDLRLTALESDRKVRILSSPRVVTLDNKEAMIRQGAKVPFSIATTTGPVTQFIEADLSLKVTPHITPDKTIFMKLELTNDRPGAALSFAGPTIDQNRANTEVLIKDGETIVIGGILVNNETDTLAGIPGLMRIPILGWLFKEKRKDVNDRELVVFLTARIVPLERPAGS